jgi:hypothetical protein
VTSNERVTSATPVADATIVHVPVETRVTVVPETVQTAGVEVEKETAAPFEIDAASDTGPLSTCVSPGCGNVN